MQDKLVGIVSEILKYAVLLSLIFIVVGVGLLFAHSGGDGVSIQDISNYKNVSSFNSSSFNPSEMFSGIIHLDGIGFISFGLWVLIFTPVTVLFASLVEYLYVRNHLYILLTFIVLFNLFVAIFLSPIALK